MPNFTDDPVISKNTKENPVFNGGILGESNLFNGVLGVTYAPERAAVSGINSNNNETPNQPAGPGVYGSSKGTGVHGDSETWNGVAGISKSTIGGAGVYGESVGTGAGVLGVTQAPNTAAVSGINKNNNETLNQPAGPGVYGSSKGTGVHGDSETWNGVAGISKSTIGGAGVYGESVGPGVIGKSQTWHGIYGETQSTTGGAGVWGENKANGAGVVGVGKTAGQFFGDVEINGDTRVTGDVILVNNPSGADCSEDFDIEDSAETITPGTVLVIGNEGKLTVSNEEYDTRIAGVVSGAGNFRPAIVLHRINSKQRRMPIALIGKTFCKVDATFAPIRPGDLLTTAHTLGHAMKVIDRRKAIGAILGKAMDGLENGQGLIPILVSLR